MASNTLPPVSGGHVTSSTAEPLAPFAIRELNGPADDGVIQLTAPQYDSTIESYPEAVLSYLDEDDGETVTVGSSLELQQRLDEPIRVRRHRRRSGSVTRSFDLDRKIHIFDIQHTTDNLLVWRDHAAYSSKTPRDNLVATSTLPASASSSEPSTAKLQDPSKFAPVFAQPKNDASCIALPLPERTHRPASTDSPIVALKSIDDVLQTACQGFENHIGSLAAFLDLTAGALRTAAEKTREADTTPVENFLIVMKTVLVEASQMGIELLRELDLEPQAPKRTHGDNIDEKHDEAASVESSPEARSDSSSKSVSFVASVPQPPVSLVKSAASAASTQSPVCVSPLSDTSYLRSQGTASTRIAEPIGSSLDSTSPTKYSPADTVTFEQSNDKTNSLMDIDAWNEDFAVRFPPLTSLRRAKTVGSLRGPAGSEGLGESSESSKSNLTRYPTISQFEHDKRSDRAARLLANKTSLRARRPHPMSQDCPEQPARRYQKPTVEDTSDTGEPANAKAVPCAANLSSAIEIQSRPPGAWPERTAELDDVTAAESSGTFFNRVAGIGHSKPEDNLPRSPALSCRTSSPLADPFHPAVGALRRARTVTASNLAARLNGPFDPLSVAPGPRERVGHPHRATEHSDQNTLPQRSMTQHLPFHGLHHPAISPSALARQQCAEYSAANPSALFGRRQFPRATQPMPGSFPYPPVPQPRSAPDNDYFLRHMRSEPNFAAPAPRPTTDPGVSDCVNSLRAMGYGMTDANEDARLPMYASATFGNVSEAVEMIEDDRRAAKAILSRI